MKSTSISGPKYRMPPRGDTPTPETPRETYTRLQKSDSRDAHAWLHCAQALAGESCYTEACDACGKALEMDPENIVAAELSASLADKVLMPHEALRAYEDVLKLNPENLAAAKRYAELSCDLGDTSRAIDALDHVLQLDPDNISVLIHQGTMCFDEGSYDAAMGCARRVLDLDPGNEDALKLMKNINAETGDEE